MSSVPRISVRRRPPGANYLCEDTTQLVSLTRAIPGTPTAPRIARWGARSGSPLSVLLKIHLYGRTDGGWLPHSRRACCWRSHRGDRALCVGQQRAARPGLPGPERRGLGRDRPGLEHHGRQPAKLTTWSPRLLTVSPGLPRGCSAAVGHSCPASFRNAVRRRSSRTAAGGQNQRPPPDGAGIRPGRVLARRGRSGPRPARRPARRAPCPPGRPRPAAPGTRVLRQPR
jgi:hypothetical protein